MPGAPPARPSLRRGLAVVAFAITTLGALGGPFAVAAGAHADVVDTSPSAGAVLARSPGSVRIWFTERVDVRLGGMTLYDGRGGRVATGRLRQPSPERLVLPVRDALPDGTYIVTWNAVTEDTHSIRGTWTFRVGDAAPADATTVDLAQRLLAERRPDRSIAVVWGITRWVGFAALAVAVGGVWFAAVVWPTARDRRRVRRLVVGALVALLAATVGGLAVFGAYSRGGGPTDLVAPHLWRVTLGTRFGVVWVVRALVLVVALVCVPVLFRSGPGSGRSLPRWWAPVAVGLGGALVAAPALSGHAASGDGSGAAIALDVVHVAAMAVWLGGLAVVWNVVLTDDDPGAPGAVTRFSRTAWWCVAALVATGVLQAWRLVGSLDALRSTDFGRILVVKVVVVALVLAVAVGVRDRLRRGDDTRSLRRSIGLEVVLAAVVLAATALLVESAPPARVVTDRSGSADTVLTDRRVRVDVSVVPGRVGSDDVHVYTSRRGAVLAVPAVELTLDPPTGAGGPTAVPLRTLGPGHAFSPGVAIPTAGRWGVTVTVVTGPTDRPERVVLHGSVRIAPAS